MGLSKTGQESTYQFSALCQEGPEDKYLHEMNCEGFKGTAYLDHGGSNPPRENAQPPETQTY